jgi:hypothetical protein
MEVPLNPLGDNPEGPVAPVDPADLRSVWEMLGEVQARRPEHISSLATKYTRVRVGLEQTSGLYGSGPRLSECWTCSECSNHG